MEKYNLFRTTYTDRKTKQKRQSPTLHVHFRDHLNRRQRYTGGTEKEAHAIGAKLAELVDCRREGMPMSERLRRWLDSLPMEDRARLVEMDLIDPLAVGADKPLTVHMEGMKDDADALTIPGYRQALEARGVTPHHVYTSVRRVADTFKGCGLNFWRDLARPAAATQIETWLGKRRSDGKITGKTLNYYIREIKSFCRWMAETGRAPTMALANLRGVKNDGADSEERRALSVDEMHWLLAACLPGKDAPPAPIIQGITGDDRALLYRFAFETGIRPGQMRSLTVADFNLDADPPTVTTQAQYVKRRRTHTQVLRSALAAELRGRFKVKLPTAAAFTMPNKHKMAVMLREDLAAARKVWIDAAAGDKEREQRQRSDFLADVDHERRRTVFYSTRHGHGTALADAGVPEKDIAASMHHASRTTTARYLHSDRKAVRSAIEAMPDLAYPQQAVATGTSGHEPSTGVACTDACTTGRTPVRSGAQNDGAEGKATPKAKPPKQGISAKSSDKSAPGLLAELADAMDSKSISTSQNHRENKGFSEPQQAACTALAQGGPADAASAALLELLPRLSVKQRRQLLALAQSMVD